MLGSSVSSGKESCCNQVVRLQSNPSVTASSVHLPKAYARADRLGSVANLSVSIRYRPSASVLNEPSASSS